MGVFSCCLLLVYAIGDFSGCLFVLHVLVVYEWCLLMMCVAGSCYMFLFWMSVIVAWYCSGTVLVKTFTNVLLSSRSRKGSLGTVCYCSGIFLVSFWYPYLPQAPASPDGWV